jgi:8-oxo-dGTP pyrophosphatase MutT (NUDIX family)
MGMNKNKACCLNCGKFGHTAKMCRFPTNSYGCIVFRKSADDTIRYLLIQRKYTPEYIELLRGRYYDTNDQNKKELNYQYLLLLIADLPLTERNYIIQYDFDYLWKNIWRWIGTEEQMQRIQSDYNDCEMRFNLLKKGHNFDRYGFLSFQTLFKNNPTNITEPDWELPKGKRHCGETDQECAIREFCEETALEPTDISLYLHVKPFQEKFTGVNTVKYCNSYYVAKLVNYNKPVYYDPQHIEQNKEIRKIGWFTENEIYQLINPRCLYRLKMIHDVNTLANTLS